MSVRSGGRTPGSAFSTAALFGSVAAAADRQGVRIAALIEDRAKGVGIAVFNIGTSEVVLTQHADDAAYSNTLATLMRVEPSEVLCSDRSASTKLVSVLSRAGSNVVPIRRKHYNDTEGHIFLREKAIVDSETSLEELCSNSRSLAAAALNAVVNYVEFVQRVSLNHVRVSFRLHMNFMSLDCITCASLELVRSGTGSSRDGSLFSTIDKTVTPMGKRLLRSSLLQPLKSANKINARLDAVDELLANDELYHPLTAALAGCSGDFEKSITQLLVYERRELQYSSFGPLDPRVITLLLQLKLNLEKIGEAQSALASADVSSQLLKSIAKSFSSPASAGGAVPMTPGGDGLTPRASEAEGGGGVGSSSSSSNGTSRIIYAIDDKICQDAVPAKGAEQLRTQQAFVIKPGVDGLLDVSRQAFSKLVEVVYSYRQQLADNYDLPNLKLAFRKRGYLLTCDLLPKERADEVQLPNIALLAARQKKRWQFTTKELTGLNDRINESLSDVFHMTRIQATSILEVCRIELHSLFKAAEALALVDMLVGFAKWAKENTSTRPLIDDGPIAIKAGRHPILAKLTPSIVPNDTFASGTSNFHIVSGANMSGKSTYIKQVALLAVMAHIGSHVPADFFSSPIIGRIFTRTSTDDDIETNKSSFMTEMKEVGRIVNASCAESDPPSIIIIDELGRGTSTEDGVSLAWSIAESIAGAGQSFTWFATHFQELAALEQIHTNIRCAHLGQKYAVNEGPCREIGYGIRTAQDEGFPAAVLDIARQISSTLHEQQLARQAVAAQATKLLQSQLDLAQDLLDLKTSTLSESGLRSLLKAMQSTARAEATEA